VWTLVHDCWDRGRLLCTSTQPGFGHPCARVEGGTGDGFYACSHDTDTQRTLCKGLVVILPATHLGVFIGSS